MITPTKSFVFATLTSVMALTGCSSDMNGSGRTATSQRIDSVEEQINQDGATLSRTQATGRPANMSVEEGIFIAQNGFRTGRGDPLPRRLEGPSGFSIKMGDDITLMEIVPALQRATGMRVDIRDLEAIAGSSGGEGSVENGDADSAGEGSQGQFGNSNSGSSSSDGPMDKVFRVDYTGSLTGFLDYVANQVGADWEYTGGRIKFLGAQTVTYTIWALPGSVSASGSIGGGGGDTAFGGGTPPTTSYTMDYNYWEDIESGLGAIVPEKSAKFAINRASGTVTLTGFSAVHDRVQDFIQQENSRLSRQVSVKIDILAFTSNDTDQRGGNITAMLEQVGAGLQFDVVNPGDGVVGAPEFGMTILEKDNGPLKNLTGSSAIISAMATRGKVSLLKSTTIMAANNQPTPVSLGTQKGYVKSITTETADDGSTTSTLETGLLNDGLNMTLTPRIMSSGEVMMSYHMQLTELVGLEKVTVGTNFVQLPEMQNKDFMQTVTIDSGDAMVVASHDSNKSTRESYGPFSPAFWGLGGQDGYTDTNTKVVVLLTPVVIEGSNAPRARR
jgi:type IVB pilus formation R64 PilN family outer membrane protein